jgi:hypothetical protein
MTNKTDGYSRFRGGLDLGMGIVYLILGGAAIYYKYFGAMPLQAGVAYTLGGMMILYGLFRLWRGFAYIRHQKAATDRETPPRTQE